MAFRKSPEEKEQKQLEMVKLEIKYEQFLAKKISQKRDILLLKYPELKTLFQGWLYGVYITILENYQPQEKKGKLFYLFENISESSNKYKLTYSINDNNEPVFNVSDLMNFPKSYLAILKRHRFDIKKDTSLISELIAAHSFKLDETVYIHHSDYNKLNNNIKNLVPLERTFLNSLNADEQKNLANSQQLTPERYKINISRKPKDVVKMEYRACDLYYNHNIPAEKIAVTLRNRLDKAAVHRTVMLYPYFKIYCNE